MDADEKRLQQAIKKLIHAQGDDQRLLDHLEGLFHDPKFPSLTWYWGPILYERNRAVFRSTIFNHFSDWKITKRRWKRIKWSEHQSRLEDWLAAAESNRDTNLVRRLLRWKYANSSWGIDHQAWNHALLSEYKAAPSAATRAIVLEKFDDWFEMNEPTAIELFETDPVSGQFILRHLPRSFWSEDKRRLWKDFSKRVQSDQYRDLYQELYRRQIPIKEWQNDVLQAARDISNAEELCDELQWRHPVGYGLGLSKTLVKILELRGRDVMPYVRSKLKDVLGGWYGDPAKPFVKLAEKNGWWDLWCETIRTDRSPKRLNDAVSELIGDGSIDDQSRRDRLKGLAGVSREWNWAGFGIAQVHALQDDVAVSLYEQYPELIHSGYKANVTPRWSQGYPKLLRTAQRKDDDELVDLLASRYAAHINYGYSFGREQKGIAKTIDELGSYYQSLRDQNPTEFAIRAANVLTRIPAYTIFSYGVLLKSNKLARLLFVRSFDSYLAVPTAVLDLLEGSDIHVQMLAYRILGQDDPRAIQLAGSSLDILIGTLLRPLHRKTRMAAFEALFNAAQSSEAAASRVLRRARESLRLPDKRYPKEELIGLIGRTLHRYPNLCGEQEQPVIYGLDEVVA